MEAVDIRAVVHDGGVRQGLACLVVVIELAWEARRGVRRRARRGRRDGDADGIEGQDLSFAGGVAVVPLMVVVMVAVAAVVDRVAAGRPGRVHRSGRGATHRR